MKGTHDSHLKSSYENENSKENVIKKQWNKPTTPYSIKTQGKDHQQETKYRTPRVKAYDI